jgi:hypothetical protein
VYASAVGMVSTEPQPPVAPKAKGLPPELPPPKLFARVARVKGAAARVACGIFDTGPAADKAAALGKAGARAPHHE